MKWNVLVLTLLISNVLSESIYDIEVPEIDNANGDIAGFTYDDKGFFETLISLGADFLNTLFGDTTSRCKGRSGFSGPDFLMFIPELKGKLYKAGDKITYQNHCFKKNTLTLKSISDGVITLVLETSDKESFLCADTTLFHNAQISHISNTLVPGSHTIKLKKLTEEQLLEVKVGGLRVFSFCDTLVNTIKSVIQTVKFILPTTSTKQYDKLFKDNNNLQKSVEEQEKDNLALLKKFANIEPKKRSGYEKKLLDLEKYIKSGDHLGTAQMGSGISTFIQLMSGGRISHSAIALKMDGKLYVVEAVGDGIIKTLYSDFIKDKLASRTTVAWFPLSDTYRKKFNEAKAVEFAKKRLGLAYGIKNFVFSLIDTKDKSLPPYMSGEHLLLIASLVEKVKADLAMMIYGYGINKRLGTSNLNIGKLGHAAAKKGKSLEDIMVMPELDSYTYHDGESWICSALVAGIYKAAGVFDSLNINAHEFTPSDVYQLAIYDSGSNRPDVCKQADPSIDYCIIVGPYAIHGNGYNSIKPYERMDEKCPTVPPDFKREKGC